MNIRPRKINSKVSLGRRESGFLGSLRAAALIVVVTGAIGSVGFMLRVGNRNSSFLLMLLFAIWVLSPFVALLLAYTISKPWAGFTRATLYSLMMVLAMGSLTLYGDVALGPSRPQPAFRFIVVPLASWLLIAIAIPVAAFLSGRSSPRKEGA